MRLARTCPTPRWTTITPSLWALLPLIATRLVSDAPLPVVGPVMVVFVGTATLSPSSEIVFSSGVLLALKTAGLKVILPPLAAPAAARASRRVQFMPLLPLGPPRGQLAAGAAVNRPRLSPQTTASA